MLATMESLQHLLRRTYDDEPPAVEQVELKSISFFKISGKHLNVFLKPLNGISVYLEGLSGFTTIKEVKLRVQEKLGVSPGEQRLICAGKQLEDERTLSDYNISEGQTIHLALRLRGGLVADAKVNIENTPPPIEVKGLYFLFDFSVYINFEGGSLTVQIDIPTSSVIDLKTIISDKLGIPVEQQCLLLLGKSLQNHEQLIDYASDLNVSSLSLQTTTQKRELRIKGYERSCTVTCYADTTFGMVKEMIHDHLQVGVKDQVLVYGGKMLKNNQKPAEVGILDGADITLVVNANGANIIKFMAKFTKPLVAKDTNDFVHCLYFLSKGDLDSVLTAGEQRVKDNKSNFPDQNYFNMLAIFLWTTNLLYKRVNAALKTNANLHNWFPYLNFFIWGVRDLYYYYPGTVYRGMPRRDITDYRPGKFVCWKSITSLSKCRHIAERYARDNGVLLEVQVSSARDISKLAVFETEQELVLLPYTYLQVLEVSDIPGSLAYVKLREVHAPRGLRVVFWVDDKPTNNRKYIWELERKGISVVCSLTTEDALRMLHLYRWMLYLGEADFRVVTDMVRDENGKMEYYAGINLIEAMRKTYEYTHPVMIFCTKVERAKENCKARGLTDDKIFITANDLELRKFVAFEN